MKLIEAFSLLALLAIMSCQVPSQIEDSKHYVLHVNLENAPFDSLYLRDYTQGRDMLFAGNKTQDFTWEISVPDSIVWDSETMVLVVSPYDSINHSSRSVRFIVDKEDKKEVVVSVGVEDEHTYIKGTYIEESIFIEEKSAFTETLFYEDFKLILQDEQADIAVRAQDPIFSWFMNFNGEALTYDDYLASYTELSKKYPNSRYLITNLSTNLKQYKSKDDVQSIYDNLSSKHKNTLWARMIDRFLSGRFENTSLPTLGDNTEENIVQDTSKYNLVIFSASWCGPCIEEIPLLKEIHKDLKKDLVLTFVCMDDDKTVASFQKIIQERNIPWRTLFAYQDIKKIEQKYAAETIPHNILVHPNGDTEIIDVRNDEDRAMLYSLF